MPRCARIKSSNSIFHIMVRSISEVMLFKTAFDKKQYLDFIKSYQKIYNFKVYAYCLMSNHEHFLIDSNGADISKIMHSINLKYAKNFNKKYKRHGHLFQDRFKSKIITSDQYLITVSAYIHNNPIDIKKYRKHPEKYEFSSLPVYLGLKKDSFQILDEDFIMQLFNHDVNKARNNYKSLMNMCTDENVIKEIEFNEEKTIYKSERKIIIRNFSSDDIMDFVSAKTGVDKFKLYIKNSHSNTKARALCVLLMRGLCNFKCSDICKSLGNITQSRVSSLCSMGINIIDTDPQFKNIINNFILTYKV